MFPKPMFRNLFWVAQRFSAAIGRCFLVRALAPEDAAVSSRLTGTLAAIAVLTLALAFSAQAQKPSGANLTEDLPPGTMQAKATTACMECHEARIVLQQRLSKAAWTKEVDKMTKWGAVVDPADHDALIEYLSTNFSPDKPPYQPPRTSAKSGK